MTAPRLSVQLYTLRDQVEADYAGTLRAVAELGYRAVELVTLGQYTPAELRAELDRNGLTASGMHIPFERLTGQIDEVSTIAETLGFRHVICPWLAPARRGDVDGYRQLVEALAAAGAQYHARGLQLGYHNHDFEFEPIGDTTALDLILGATDARSLMLELDVYWAAYAGLDPVATIQRYADRLALVHLKDMARDPSRTFAEVGHGQLDVPAILAACDAAGVEWLVVEQDQCTRPPLESVAMSLEYLRSLGRA